MTGSQSGSVMSATSTSPGLYARHLPGVAHYARRACADSLADAPAGREDRRAFLEREALDRASAAALDRLGPRLQDEDLAARAVFAPFDVHRAAVMLLDDERLARERNYVLASSSRRSAHACAAGTCDGGATRSLAPAARVDHLDRLAAEVFDG